MHKSRFLICAVVSGLVVLVLLLTFGLTAEPAAADGTPDLSMTKDMPPRALLGDEIPVLLEVSNPSGPNGYNLTVTDVLPAGISYVAGSASAEPVALVQPDGTTVLVWENIADSPSGTTVKVEYSIVPDATWDVADVVTNSANAYAHSNPRTLPVVEPTTGVVTGGFSGNASASDSTVLDPFEITKTEPSAESELLRGVHSHQTVYTLTIDNNFINPSSSFSIVDYLPAQLEFLGCGGVDNSTVGEEYPGSGPINPGNEPGMSNPCITPTSVTTVTVDPDGAGPLPNGVYTRIEWDSATLGVNLAASGSYSMDYIAAIPLRENVDIALADPTANLDNNTGAVTTESEASATNYAVTSGVYFNDGASSSDDDYEVVVIEDISIHKTVDSETYVQGDTPVWTLLVETSEYALSTGPVTVTDTLPSSLDFTSATPAPDSAVIQADGTTLITWTLPANSAPSSSMTITINTLVREDYRQGDGSGGAAVASNDSHTNTTDLSAGVTVIADNDGSTTTVPLDDESSASQESFGPSILKAVSEPVSGTMTCGDGSGVTFDPVEAGNYRPGDRVCWLLTVDFPSNLDTFNPTVTDFLPDGFEYESWTSGAGSALADSDYAFTNNDPQLVWSLTDQDAGAVHVEIVVSTLITDPTAAESADVLSNLMKFSYTNLAGEVFQLRDAADATYSEALLDLDKGVIELNGGTVVGAPADGITVQEGDVVSYQLAVSNIGEEDALDTSVRDVLPPGITCADVSNIASGGVCNAANNWIQWNSALNLDIAAASTLNLTYDVTVPVGTSAGASLVNTAGVRTYGGETNSGTPVTYVPSGNIDPTLTPNTDPADDDSEIVTAPPILLKTVTTEFDEPGNAAANAATIGETVTYTVDVDLPAGATYYVPVFTDVVDADKELLESTVTATINGLPLGAGFTVTADDATNTITVTFPTPYIIPNGDDEELLVTFDAVIIDDAANVRGARSSNSAEFNYQNAAGIDRSVNDSADVTIVEPNIVLDKAHNDADGVITAGQTVTYTLDVENSTAVGNVSVAHDTVVVDTIPTDLIVLNAAATPAADGDTVSSGGVWDASARTITWTIATIDPGATVSLAYDVQGQDPLVAAGSITNTAEAVTTSMPGATDEERTDDSPDGDGYDDPAEATVMVPVLDLTKTVDPTLGTIGEPVTYTLDVSIPAGVIAYDVTVIDDLPAGIAFESLTSVICGQGGAACSPDIVTTDAGVVEGGGDVAFFFDDLTTSATGGRVVTITYVAVIDDDPAADAVATLTNSAAIYWNSVDTITSVPTSPPPAGSFGDSSTPDSADVETDEPTLVINKDVTGQTADDDNRRAVPGETLEYTITVINTGTGDAFNATVSDTPTDDNWAFSDTTTAAGVNNTDNDPVGGLEWTIDGPIAPGSSVTIAYELTVPPGYDSSNEVAAGPEQENTADSPSYFGVDEATRDANPDRDYRDYDDVVADVVEIELDLASIGDTLWFDANNDGVQDASEPLLANIDVTVTYLGPDGVPGGDDDEVSTVSTDADGEYLVDDLPGGEYTVVADTTDPDFIAGLVPSYDLDDGVAAPNSEWEGTLGEDEDKLDVDFGYTGTGSIGDTVWVDQNQDGVVDASEGRLPGVDVTVTWHGSDGLSGSGDDIVYTTTTDANGEYLVEDLPPGEYTVDVDVSDLPVGYSNVSDPESDNNNTSSLTLGIGEDNLDQDFGYTGSGSIGDTIWLDQNGDGVEDPSEPGLGGVAAQLTHYGPDGVPGGGDDSVYTTTTPADGTYLFEDLPPGEYEVAVTGSVPANVTNSYDPDTGGPGDSVSTLTLDNNEDNLDQDFGFTSDTLLGDRIWWDLNEDGVQDAGEPGLNGIEVTATYLGLDGVLGTVDDEVFVTTTSGGGDYLFLNVPDGGYIVAATSGVPAGLLPTFDEDSGIASPDETTNVALVTEHLTADFGYAGDGSIGDTIWFDHNQDGVIDADEFGIEGVTVSLTWLGADGVPGGGDDITLATTTDTNGNYLFDNLPEGEFVVDVDEATLPAGLAPAFDADGGDDSTSAVTLADGEANLDQDFGNVGSGSIGDTIWLDQDGDGIQDPGEVGIGGVTVTITWAGPFGPETFTTTTDADGNYLIENVPAGDFTVEVDLATLPPGLTNTFDPDGLGDSISALTLTEGEANLDQDFAYQGEADIGDAIWLDLNGDGVPNPGEPGIPNQTVELSWDSVTGPVTFTTTTDANGNYLFPGLPDSDYTVTVIGGIVDAADNTADPDNPGVPGDSTSDLTITGGADNLDQEFGYQGINTIGDQVWIDYNQNGIVDANEPGIENAVVTLTWFGPDGVAGGGDDIVFPSMLTDSNGNHGFENLPDGSYSIVVDAVSLPAGVTVPTYDADNGTSDPDSTSIVTDLGVGDPDPASDFDQDFGYTGNGSIGDTIWLNLDGDTEQDPNESAIPGVTVTLTGAGPDGIYGTADDAVYPPQVTDENGMYLFEDLPPGDYQITYDVSTLAPGLDPELDLDGSDLASANITLGPDEENLDVDFAVTGNATVSGTIFVDLDGDGEQGPGGEPLEGITIIVTWEGPDGPVEFTVIADENGEWELPNVPPGDYTVAVDENTVPSEHLATIPATVELTVDPNGEAEATNAFAPEESIGDTIWRDDNRDGVVDSGEDGVEGVTVNLLDEDGNIVATTTTDASGNYLFETLLPGTYTVSVDTSTLPDGYDIVSSPDGSTSSESTFTIAGGADRDDIDFGVDPPEPQAALAFTGRTITEIIQMAMLLIAAGAGLTLLAGRRRRTLHQ